MAQLDINALVAKAKADAAAAEQAANAAKAAAAAGKAKTASANKIQAQANQKFDYAKSLKSSLQDIEDEIMSYVTRLSRGDKLSSTEQRRLDDLGKQYNSVSSNYTNTLKQGNDLLATIPAETKPSIPSAAPKQTGTALGTGAGLGTETTGATVDSVNAQIDGLLKNAREDIATMSDPERLNLAKTLTAAGYKTPEIGKFNDALVLNYQAALSAAKTYNTNNKDIIAKNILKPLNFTDFLTNQTQLVNQQTGGAGGVAKAGTFTRTLPTTTNTDDAKAYITKIFQSTLNRLPSSKELADATKALNAHEAKNPLKEKYTIDANGNIVNRATSGGSNPEQFLLDYIQTNKTLGKEYATVKQTAPDLNKLAANKKLYEDAVKAAGNDFGAMQQAKETTAYGRGLKELETQLQDKFMNAGAINDPADVARIAQDLYDKGLDLNSESGLAQAEAQMKFGTSTTTVGGKEYTGYTGKAGQNVDQLRAYAASNGLKLEDVFGPVSTDTLPNGTGNSLSDVLSAINRGEAIDTYARIIRDAAKTAWKVDDKVAALMDQGVSLNAIYAPYKNAYADTLEINPEQVSLNDLAKYNVVGGDGMGGNLFDFRKALRKDPRWQYTQQANQEVAAGVQKVLQDFGFMG